MRRSLLSCVVPAVALAVMTSEAIGAQLTAGAKPRYTVLAIHWGPEDFPSNYVINAAIRQGLASDANVPIDYFTEFLESDLFDPTIAAEALAEYIQRKYRGRRIDVVMAIADPALEFVLHYRPSLFPTAEIVYSGVAIPESAARGAVGITGELRAPAHVQTLELALRLHPTATQVFVIANGQDRRNAHAVHAALEAVTWP